VRQLGHRLHSPSNIFINYYRMETEKAPGEVDPVVWTTGSDFLEPIRKELESVESVVIHCAAPFVRKEGAGCGRRNIVEFTLARVCAIRAI
jgi:hypothetical protein